MIRGSHLTASAARQDHGKGPDDAPITLMEYGDYQCAYSKAAEPVVKAIQRRLEGRLHYVFRHFPLRSIHPDAQEAAEAAEAAGAQGAFWEMHEKLFQNQVFLDQESLLRHAEDLGLDVRRFQSDLKSGRFHDKVRKDFTSGVQNGVNSTHAFFINGRRYEGEPTADGLLKDL